MNLILNSVHLFGQEAQDTTPVGAVFTVSAALVGFVLATLIPLATALLTKLNAHPLVKYIVTAVLSAIAAVLNSSITDSGIAVVSWNTVLLAISTLIVSIFQYKALWQPSFNINAKVAPTFGIGGTKTP